MYLVQYGSPHSQIEALYIYYVHVCGNTVLIQVDDILNHLKFKKKKVARNLIIIHQNFFFLNFLQTLCVSEPSQLVHKSLPRTRYRISRND